MKTLVQGESIAVKIRQGRQTECLFEVWMGIAAFRVRRMGGLDGVTGRSTASISARLMNCSGVKGDPLIDGEVDLTERGLRVGVSRI